MLLLHEIESFDLEQSVQHMREIWELDIDNEEFNEEALIIDVEGYVLAIGPVRTPINVPELEHVVNNQPFWRDAKEEVEKHQAHVLVTLLRGGENPVQQNKVYTLVMSSLLAHSHSIGVYMPTRNLLIKRDLYLEGLKDLKEGHLPIHSWIYLGFIQNEQGQSIFTYGLQEFGHPEIEVVRTARTINELHSFLLNITAYVLSEGTQLQEGEMISFTPEEKYLISFSEGHAIREKSIKIKY